MMQQIAGSFAEYEVAGIPHRWPPGADASHETDAKMPQRITFIGWQVGMELTVSDGRLQW